MLLNNKRSGRLIISVERMGGTQQQGFGMQQPQMGGGGGWGQQPQMGGGGGWGQQPPMGGGGGWGQNNGY